MQHRDPHLSRNLPHAVEPLEPRTLLAAELPADGILRVTGTRKADTIFVTYGPDALDTIFVRINNDSFSFRTDEVNGIRIQAGALGDHIEFAGFATNADHFDKLTTIYGSTGDDFILGAGSSNRIYGGTGNDKINAGYSRDTVYGEEGSDTIDGGQGNDRLSGGIDNDRITGGLGIDKMFGDEGRDTLLSRGDLPALDETRPFVPIQTFDLVDGGAGRDRADVDSADHRVSVEELFINM